MTSHDITITKPTLCHRRTHLSTASSSAAKLTSCIARSDASATFMVAAAAADNDDDADDADDVDEATADEAAVCTDASASAKRTPPDRHAPTRTRRK